MKPPKINRTTLTKEWHKWIKSPKAKRWMKMIERDVAMALVLDGEVVFDVKKGKVIR